MRKLLTLAALLALAVCPAFAGLSQIGAHFPAQNAPLTNAVIVPGGGTVDGSYLVSIYATQNHLTFCGISGITYTLNWTDERGNPSSRSIATTEFNTGSGDFASMVVHLRKKASDPVTISTSYTVFDSTYLPGCVAAGLYGLYVDGFGFWPNQAQKQAGITEARDADSGSIYGKRYTLVSNVPASYLVAVETNNVSGSIISWSDEYGTQSANASCVAPCESSTLQPVRLVSGSSSQLYVTAGSAGTGARGDTRIVAAAVKFAVPGIGPGPLTDYEFWQTNFTWNYTAVFIPGTQPPLSQPNIAIIAGEISVPFPVLGSVEAASDMYSSNSFSSDACNAAASTDPSYGAVPSVISLCSFAYDPAHPNGVMVFTSGYYPPPQYDVYYDMITF